MRLHRFFLEKELPVGNEVVIPDHGLSYQLKKVLRLNEGENIILFNGSGFDFVSKIISFEGESGMRVMILDKKNSCFIPQRNVHLFLSITKKDNFEWALEKCTELGVAEFTPLVSDRTEKKNIDMGRLALIMKEATEQSGRCGVPILNEVKTFEEVVTEFESHLFLFHPTGRIFKPDDKVVCTKLLIGPEGGWSDKEVEQAQTHGAHVVTLGKQILRAETAAVAVGSLLLL